ncbi:A-kinase anchor protein 13 [Neolamprologus brichardi]|nr:A-kinase anchor protein 13 [Neolamprologus brichardi]
MKLNPQQAPLYGHCVITVQLSDDELAGSEEGVDYFLLFAGSTQRHLTSTLRSSHDTLQALCPAHDCCEVVLVTLCSVTRGVPEEPQSHLVHVAPLAEHRFSFVQDLAFDMAQFLVSTVGRADGLDGALLLDECQIPLQECERLDESLALALHHLKLPTGWNLLGNKRSNSTDLNPQETLLHFSARRGLFQVTHFLLQQAGARGALRLANRQGDTPSAVAELRGHKCLHELLTKAQTDPEKDEEPVAVQQVSEDVQVFCHLPKLNTHTLTLSIHPGRDTPSFQKSVEQLLHLICHLHAKGVSLLKLQFDSLHTAAECSDGVKADLTCLDRLQQSDTASECLDTTTQGSWLENCPVESSSTVDCRHSAPGNAEKDCSLTVSTPTSEVHPQEHGLVPPEDWVCSNTERDYSKAEEEEEQERPVVSMQGLSLSDRTEGVQSEAEGKGLTVGILPQAGCGKQAEETDRGEAVIQEGQEAKKGEDRSEQEAEDSTAKRREEEISSELTDLLKASGDTNESIMGQSASSSYSEVSDNSDSEVKECSQEEETVGKEDAKHSRDVCDVLSVDANEEESEGLTDTLSTPMDLPDPTLIECGDVIKEPEPVPCLLIEGLHEGEPLPDINSLEQNQETAGRDYATEQEWGLASESGCHSGSCTDAVGGKELHSEDVVEPSGYRIESSILPAEEADSSAVFLAFSDVVVDTQTDSFDCEPLPDKMPTERQADHDSGTAHGLSSDDDGSFRSAGSSTTEIFQPAHGSVAMEDQDLLQSVIVRQPSAGFEIEAPSDFKPEETCEHFTTVDTGLSSEPDTQLESEPKLLSLDDLNSEATENLAPDLSKEDLSFDSAGSEDTPTAQVEESETEETNSSDLNVGIELSASGLGSGALTEKVDVIKSEDTLSDAGEEQNGPAEGADFSTIHRDRETSFHQPCNTQHSGSSESSTFSSLPSRTSSATSCPSSAHRDSGSDIESFLNAEPGYDSIFRKNDEPVTGGDSTSEVSVSCSSTDDTASVGPTSSSPEGSQGLGCSWSPEEGIQTVAPATEGLDSEGGEGGGAGEAEEEAKDRVTEVPRRSCLFRNSNRSLSPLRRHSWGPGKNNGGDGEMNQRSSTRSSGERKPAFHRRSYSLEGLSGGPEELRGPTSQGPRILEPIRIPRQDSDDRGSLVSLTEEQEDRGEYSRVHDPKSRRYRPLRNSCPPMSLPLTKSVSMLAISQRDIDGMRFSSTSGSLAYSISEEEPGPLRSDTEGKSVTKVSRTFSYLKNKMYKKTREKERDKREKDKEGKEKDKKTVNGHVFTPVSSNHATQCSQCNKGFNGKDAFHCTYCNASVHKGCRDSLAVCAKVKMKLPNQQFAVPDSSLFPTVTMRNKPGGTKERPWSAILPPEDHSTLMIPSRRHTNIMTFTGNNLSKSLSISNIAGPVFDEMPIKGLRYLSQSTDSLNRTNQVTESMESLTDEGTEMMDGQLMGEFEAEAKELEADSWSLGVDQQHLQQLDKELVKRQDVIYELMQTEMHHVRTLRIMSEVYSKGLQKEVQLEQQMLEKLFPVLDDLLELHTQHLLRLLERKKESQLEGRVFEGGFIISRIGDILGSQFSGSNGESMKRVYGRFCSRHNEAVNFHKDLLNKDKRFKAFIKKKMSSSIVRRLGIPECILLVTQRITKYPVLIQRLLQHTKESDEDYFDLTEAIRLVKEVIAAVDSKVNEHEKRRRLKEFHGRMDNKSIMMMKNGQIFAREDLLRRRLIHDGALQLKNTQGRLKEVHALLLSDVFVFLQEKDQKYVFAMLDQRSTVISLQKLIVREVANEERGLFLITAGIEKPEMMEVLASSKDERNTWMQLIQEAMQSMDKDEDEGIPSETEDDKRQLETKAKEMRELLRQKDTEIMSLLEEKVRLFRGMWEGVSPGEEACRQVQPFFRSPCSLEPPGGASIMKDALQEVETLQTLVNGSLGGAMASVQEGGGGGAGPVCLPRRAETFGGFDSHQMHSSKSGDRDESEDMAGDLRRTESDSVLKKGGNANLLQLLKRNSEQVLHSVSNLHLLLSTLQAVVVQQDSFIEDQRQALSERSSSCTSLSRPSSRPSSLIEQEKQRSLEKQRQELASLQRQQAAHAEEKRRREKEWEHREKQLAEREAQVHAQEEEILKQQKDLEEEKQELQNKKEEYQKDLERLRDAQRKLERDREAMQRHLNKMEDLRLAEPKGKGLNPFTSSSTNLKGSEGNNQISKSLLQLAKNKGKDGKEKEKKKKKAKGGSAQSADSQPLPEPPLDGEIFFC